MSQAHIATRVYQAFPSRVYIGLRWGRQGGKLPSKILAKVDKEKKDQLHHAGAWKRVPTKPNPIAILDLTPLVF